MKRKKQVTPAQVDAGALAAKFFAIGDEQRGNLDGSCSAVFAAMAAFDSQLTGDFVHEHEAEVLEFAAAVQDYAASLTWVRNRLDNVFANAALNLVMLVIEDREKHNAEKAAVEPLVMTAYELAKLLIDTYQYSEKFPPAQRILHELQWHVSLSQPPQYAGPILLCNVEAARVRLTALHEEIQGRLDAVRRNLGMADHILHDAASKVRSCLHEFYEYCLGDQVMRSCAPPFSLGHAQSWILAAERFHQAIDEKDFSQANVNHSARAWSIASLAASQAEVDVARAIVEAVSKAKGYADFEVLGHQALAYAEATQEENWTFFAPPIFARPELELCQDSERVVRMFSNYAELALCYANTLKMELRVVMAPDKRLPARQFHNLAITQRFEIDEENPSVLDEFGCRACTWIAAPDNQSVFAQAIEPAKFPQVRLYHDPAQMTQSEIEIQHSQITGDDLREDHWLGIRSSFKRYHPKRRLVGFEGVRGRGCRKKRRAA